MDVVVGLPSSPPESGCSSPSLTASPEFEFWMVGKNPGSFPSPALLTADELFSDGIVLPLHTLQAPPACPDAEQDQGEEGEDTEADADPNKPPEEEGEPATQAQPLAEACAVPTPDLPAVTFKWKDIFKATGESKERAKKAERRVSSVSGNAELININIWPFSRSRSAGHSTSGASAGASSKAKATSPSTGNASAAVPSAPAAPATAAGRKVSSAPCSRSNSRGEASGSGAPAVAIAAAAEKAAAQAPATSMLRRWVPGGQSRAVLGTNGIRLGRASPVWQLRRNKLQHQQAAAEQKQSSKNKAVPEGDAATSQGQADAGEADKATASAADAAPATVSAPAAACRNNAACAEVAGEECVPPQGLFGLRTFFSKKVY
ncbi:hypothetical protein CFC21_043595 [Triticum aestivum]|uniref:Uncharacterized protein n=3 Tax=Triticum TaxID=4564 RepID=A0A9R1FPX4_WHEAT|nr:AF4/FMR2 family member lilli-like [Triticum dicoccoides]XP_044351531.1 AF4/FMR2 family member lilli-like [Triticum aestivum]VAH83791.1 unnamed protein product [Triticum turgidum subsp. durum]KAF7032423.1 hypothetical protein CFC21_043595 [Triticum aestivum]CDM85783.1 unnamed protein product [Triticum aestivum]VAH83798.1 unnamed protein product [Triticum turgidum subsp. durum]